jgi:hypothetical protein
MKIYCVDIPILIKDGHITIKEKEPSETEWK